jgi:ABC-2 type transport system ATP-binding protein
MVGEAGTFDQLRDYVPDDDFRRINWKATAKQGKLISSDFEPTVGVDPQSRQRLFEMVEAERDNGACVVYTTHYMEEAERLCDSLAIIDHGKVIALGTVKELRAKLGARDALHLSGHFPQQTTRSAIESLTGHGLQDLEIVSQSADSLMLTLTEASQNLPAVFKAVADAGGKVTETNLRSPNLETLFLLLTGKELRE